MSTFFDATAVAPRTEFSVLPAASYRFQITACEKKTGKTSGVDYLSVELTVVDGQYANRKLWVNLNLWNPKADVKQRAEEEMSDLCHAVGILKPTGPQDFVNRTLVGKVKVRTNKESKEQENQVTKYEADGGPGSVTQAAAAPAATATPRWAAARPAAA